LTSVDQLRIVPDSFLNINSNYRLVLSATDEIAVLPQPEGDAVAALDSVVAVPGGIRVRFNKALNPLSVRQNIRLRGADGSTVHFWVMRSLTDPREFLLISSEPNAGLLVNLSGPESK
jgi:hypothetical protein